LRQFYNDLDDLCAKLIAGQQGGWEDELRTQQRNGTTSSKVLVKISEVLHRLLSSGVADLAGCRAEVEQSVELCNRIWRGSYEFRSSGAESQI
jgi:hypothetical protein